MSILSDAAPTPARQAGLDARFQYWRGHSGRRYLFSAVSAESLADFRSVVVMLAEALPDGRFAGRSLHVVDGNGRTDAGALRANGLRCFVHFLAASDGERRRLIDDLAAPVRRAA